MKHKIVALQPKDEYYSETGRESRIVLGSFPLSWEQRKLGELAEFSKGQGYTKSDLRESGIPIILYGRLYTKYQPIIREVDTFADATPQAVFSKGGEVILPSSGETAEDTRTQSV
ncbi:restriction endonuclease subunit S domain-containing protein [Acidaminobacterium chupaoyuni]